MNRADRLLFRAIEASDADGVADALFQGANPDAGNEIKSSALFLAAYLDDPSCLILLLAAGADFDQCRPSHPARAAIYRGNAAALEALLDAGLPVGAVRDGSSSLLCRAAGEKKPSCVELLLRRGACCSEDAGEQWRHPMVFAVESMLPDRVELLAASEPEHWRSPRGVAQLSGALRYALRGNRDLVFIQTLLRAGANPLLSDSAKHPDTGLSLGVFWSLEIVHALIDACPPGEDFLAAAERAASLAKEKEQPLAAAALRDRSRAIQERFEVEAAAGLGAAPAKPRLRV